jgi:hypothetical protein
MTDRVEGGGNMWLLGLCDWNEARRKSVWSTLRLDGRVGIFGERGPCSARELDAA